MVDSVVNGTGPANLVKESLNGNEQVSHTLQIIDDQQAFTPELSNSITRWGLYEAGFGYDVVAVFGSQSTGKSTLLNRLFGSTFSVMSETERRQTTKGIWMTKAKNMNVLVMDVEGTDGRERGEDQDFERKSALFSLATSEVLIINLWEHQVGLYQGANMGLLKTVFEVNLGLFQGSPSSSKGNTQKTLLLFVIRDHIGTPLPALRATLTADIQRIWTSLSKPAHLSECSVDDYFDLEFFALPHKLLQPEAFEKEVGVLRGWFDGTGGPEGKGIFRPSYHKRIPADGVGTYMEGIWEQVVSNKDLDLPTQQELLAQFRCDEIGAKAFEEFEHKIGGFRRPVESGAVVEELGKAMKEGREEVLRKFDGAASRYHQGVYKKKRGELKKKVESALLPLFVGQIRNVHKVVVAGFKSNLTRLMIGEYDFGSIVTSQRDEALEKFKREAEILVLDDSGWSWEDEEVLVGEEIEEVAKECRAIEVRKTVERAERGVAKECGEKVEVALNKPGKGMWDGVLGSFGESLRRAEKAYLKKAKSFNATEEESEKAIERLRKKTWLGLKKKVEEQTADGVLLVKLKMAFEERFRYDEDGVPRIWRPEDDIDGLFRKARESTLALIPLYTKIEPTDSTLLTSLNIPSTLSEGSDLIDEEEIEFENSLTILSESKCEEITSKFRREADAYYVEAKRSMVSSVSQIPYWMYAVVALLGWNEFVAVIRSPIYFAMLLVFAAMAYIIFKLGMAGPVLALAQSLSKEMFRVANEQLRSHYASQVRGSEERRPGLQRTGTERTEEGIPLRDLKKTQ